MGYYDWPAADGRNNLPSQDKKTTFRRAKTAFASACNADVLPRTLDLLEILQI